MQRDGEGEKSRGKGVVTESGRRGEGSYRLIDFDFLGDVDGLEDLKEHSGGLVGLGELRPVCFVGGVLKRLDVLLVVVLVEALHLPGIALLDPALEGGIVLPLEPLEEGGLELANTTAAGGGVEAMGLLESVEAAWVGWSP
jgi:hypothetical protein